jgi:hypothetical protein
VFAIYEAEEIYPITSLHQAIVQAVEFERSKE